jgi:hypothetical protein
MLTYMVVVDTKKLVILYKKLFTKSRIKIDFCIWSGVKIISNYRSPTHISNWLKTYIMKIIDNKNLEI